MSSRQAAAPETPQPARIYAKLNLRLQNRFRSRYALILWEICFDYFDTDRDQGETPFIALEVFKSLMGLEKEEYPIFKVLNRDRSSNPPSKKSTT